MSIFDRENKIDSQVLMNIGFEYFPVYHETGTEDQYRLVLEARDIDGYHSQEQVLFINRMKLYQHTWKIIMDLENFINIIK